MVVARHAERIDWVFYYTMHFNLTAFVYNDGRSMKSWAHVPLQLPPRVHVRRSAPGGDECSKYLRFIMDCYPTLHVFEWIVFTQAYPFDHSPDFVGLMQSARKWSRPVQVLSYYGHPGPWGPAGLANNSLNESFVAGHRVWCSRMSNGLQAEEWHDPWLQTTGAAQGGRQFPVRLSTWWRRHNVSLPLPPRGRVCKMFGSIFASQPHAVQAHPRAFWQHLLRTHTTRPACYQLENMFQPLLMAAAGRSRH